MSDKPGQPLYKWYQGQQPAESDEAYRARASAFISGMFMITILIIFLSFLILCFLSTIAAAAEFTGWPFLQGFSNYLSSFVSYVFNLIG